MVTGKTKTTLCPTLRSQGTCGKAACIHTHDLRFVCFECNAYLESSGTRGLDRHLKKSQHHRSSKWLNEHPICPICHVIVAAQVWIKHAGSKRHRMKMTATGQHPDGPVISRLILPGTVASCDPCRKHFSSTEAYEEHCRGNKHNKQVKLAVQVDRLRHAHASKNGVAVTADPILEFGEIDPTTPSPQALSITASTDGVRLLAVTIPGSAKNAP